jgi:hypothetical protein
MITTLGAFVVLLVGLGSASAVFAQPRDQPQPLLCAMMTVLECDAAGACTRRTAESKELPPFLVVDPGQQMVRGLGTDPRRTPITSAKRFDGQLIVQGGEAGRGWSATITETTGKMAVAVVDDDVTFSIFGTCVRNPGAVLP